MTMDNLYIETSANALIFELDRKNIFPPLLNDPESFISQKRDTKRTPNAFLICKMNVHKEAVRKGINSNMRTICKATSILWKNASLEEKNKYKQLADNVKSHFDFYINQTKNSYNPYYSFQVSTITITEASFEEKLATTNNIRNDTAAAVAFNNYNEIESDFFEMNQQFIIYQ